MCGRFTLTSPVSRLVEFFALLEPDVHLEPRYNIAPAQSVACIRRIDGFRNLSLMRWGLLPFFARHINEGARMINARSESVATKPAFRRAFESQRCIVPADGFFEWKKQGSDKQPFLIRLRSAEPFAFAGLWDRWTNPEDDGVIESFTILTTTPNALMEPVHDRMPVILPEETIDAWLSDSASADDLQDLLRPFDPTRMEAFPVARSVGNVRNDTPDCLAPIDSKTQQELF